MRWRGERLVVVSTEHQSSDGKKSAVDKKKRQVVEFKKAFFPLGLKHIKWSSLFDNHFIVDHIVLSVFKSSVYSEFSLSGDILDFSYCQRIPLKDQNQHCIDPTIQQVLYV